MTAEEGWGDVGRAGVSWKELVRVVRAGGSSGELGRAGEIWRERKGGGERWKELVRVEENW